MCDPACLEWPAPSPPSEAFPGADDEIGPVQRPDRAEHDLHAARGDDFFRLDDVIHEQRQWSEIVDKMDARCGDKSAAADRR